MRDIQYNITGKSIIDNMPDEEKIKEVTEMQELIRNFTQSVFKLADLYGERWLLMNNGYRKILGKKFKAYTELGWLENIAIDITSKDKTIVYVKIEPCNDMY